MSQFHAASVARTHRHRRVLAAALSSVLACAALAASAAPALAFGGDGLRAAANGYRTDHRLDPVFGTALLDDIASHRASQMVARDAMVHDIDYVVSRLSRAGVCWEGVGEIIAWDTRPDYDYDATMLDWWGSKDHHAIVMTPDYNAAGGAWRSGDGGAHYSVMVFVEMCGSAAFERQVSLLRPSAAYDPDRKLFLAGGWHSGLRFDKDGHLLRRKAFRYDHAVTRTTTGRVIVDGKAYLKVGSGAMRGYWVREGSRNHVRGFSTFLELGTALDISMEAGRYRGHEFNWHGGVTDSRALTFGRKVHAMVTAKAVINGHPYLRIKSGHLGGYWVRNTGDIHFL
jgi:uncharacterized protein YkwD